MPVQDSLDRVGYEVRALWRSSLGASSSEELATNAPVLCELARRVSQLPTRAAVRMLLTEACNRLEFDDRSDAAKALLGLDDDTYRMGLGYRRRMAAAKLNIAVSTFRQGPRYEKALLSEVAASIVQTRMHDDRESPSTRESWVARPHEERLIRDRLRSSRPWVIVWGEAGVGKTALVDSVLAESEWTTVVRIDASSRERALIDVWSALAESGEVLQGLGERELLAMFRIVVRRLTADDLIVIENVVDDSVLRDLLDSATQLIAAVVIVSREWVAVEGFEAVAVRELSLDQMTTMCEHSGLTVSDELLALCETVGRRALAVHQILQMLARFPDLTAGSLLDATRSRPATTMGSVASASRSERSLTKIYELLSERVQTQPARLLLVGLLAFSDRGTVEARQLKQLVGGMLAMQGDFQVDTLYFELLGDLEDLALVHQGDGFVIMHSLTWELLGQICFNELQSFGTSLLECVESAPAVDDSIVREPGLVLLALMKDELDVSRGIRKDIPHLAGLGDLIILSATRWLRILPGESITFVDVFPFAIYEYIAGARHMLDRESIDAVLEYARAYRSRTMLTYDRLGV